MIPTGQFLIRIQDRNQNYYRSKIINALIFPGQKRLIFSYCSSEIKLLIIKFFISDLYKLNYCVMDIQKLNGPLVITYYPIRAKAQVCRLLCQYLHLQYIDNFVNPLEWENIKKTKDKNLVIWDLPCLQDGNFSVTSNSGMTQYIVLKSGRTELLGKNFKDQMIIDKLKCDLEIGQKLLGFFCSNRGDQSCVPNKIEEFYRKKIQPILEGFQKMCQEQNWCLGYITILDFIIYEIIYFYSLVIPQKIEPFSKLRALYKRVYNLPEISKYQTSSRAVRCPCPIKYFKEFKQKTLKQAIQTTSKFTSCKKSKAMDIE